MHLPNIRFKFITFYFHISQNFFEVRRIFFIKFYSAVYFLLRKPLDFIFCKFNIFCRKAIFDSIISICIITFCNTLNVNMLFFTNNVRGYGKTTIFMEIINYCCFTPIR